MQESNSNAFRLSLQQRNLWTLQQGAGHDPLRAVCAIALDGRLRPEVLQRALGQLVARHEILRTTFQRPPGIKTPFQVVSALPEYAWQTIDAEVSAAAAPQVIARSVTDEAERAADLERGPTLRATLVKLAENRHVLVLALPMLCADEKTLSNMTAELAAGYGAALGGPARDDEPLQYVDYAQWQEDLVESDDPRAAEGKAYWRDVARAAAPPPALPLRRRPAGSETSQQGTVSIRLDDELAAAISSLATAEGTTVSVALFACWQALLWRLAGEPESAFTLHRYCDGRKLQDLESGLGLYGRYLPTPSCVRNEPFSRHLRRAAESCASAEEWQDYADVDAGSDAAVAFAFIEGPEAVDAGGVSFSLLPRHTRLRPLTLALSCVRTARALSADVLYDRREIDDAVAARFAGYFERLLAAVAADGDCTLGDVEILGEAERNHLLFALNRTQADFPGDLCIHQLIEAQAARTPDAVAVVAAHDAVTYGALNARANRLAHLLRRSGVQANVPVGLCLDRSVDMMIGLLGILKAGGAYVPLNREHPPVRRARQLTESGAPVLVTNDGAAAAWPGFPGETIDLVRDRERIAAQPDVDPPVGAMPESLAYVIYTSGSTGAPKGVAIRHRSLVNYTHFVRTRLAADRPLHFATVSTLTADLGNTAIFPALVSGGCLHIIGADVAMEPRLFQQYVAERAIDVLKIVPSHLRTLLDGQSGGSILPSTYLILGGEALAWDLVARIGQTPHTCEIINHYGPTEATVGCLTCAVEGLADGDSLTVPVGRPIANMRAYILDRRLRPVPTGVTGELYVGGEGLADGYVNQPAETAARFLPDPFVDDPAARIYRTGDRARHLANGAVEFVGRADHQVKVRGYRVEPGEIEAVLTSMPEVRQAVVIAHADPSGDQRLVAYVTGASAGTLRAERLRASLREILPDYMVPSAFVVLPALPLTPNGKIDRAALPAPDDTRPDLQRAFVEPRTPIERELAAIWAGLLKLNQVGVHDNFFDVGGHSLLATRVVSQMRKAFAVEIPLNSLFESPTIAAMALEIERASSGAAARLLADVAELEQLSEEDVARLLRLERDPPGSI